MPAPPKFWPQGAEKFSPPGPKVTCYIFTVFQFFLSLSGMSQSDHYLASSIDVVET